MSFELNSPPKSDATVSFVWFTWFRRLHKAFNDLVTYVNGLPTVQGGSLKSQLLTTADTSPWTWPTGVDAVWITAVAGGGGGTPRVDGTYGGGGGGSGEYCVRYFYPRLSATTTSYTVGTGGASLSNGTATNFGGLTLDPGQTGNNAAGTGYGGKGGGLAQTAPSSRVAGARPVQEGALTWSGANGGGHASTGGPCEIWVGGYAGGTGGAGGSSPWGQGGSGGVGAAVPTSPTSTSYGAGGGGASNVSTAAGAAGQNGCILLEWIG